MIQSEDRDRMIHRKSYLFAEQNNAGHIVIHDWSNELKDDDQDLASFSELVISSETMYVLIGI